MKYVPLHLHTEYSLLDGAIRIKDLFEYARECGMPAVALTDHGNMFGAIDFYRTAKEYDDVKGLIGCELYVVDGDIEDKTTKKQLYHIVLIAKNNTGYQNLIKLDSIATTTGFYYKPRVNHELIEQYSEGIICISACIAGEVASHILDGDEAKAKETAKWYQDIFKDDYYIELQDHGLDEQKRSNPTLIKIAKELGIKMVITNDSHYLKAQDAIWHDTLLCEQTKSLKDDPNRMKFSTNEFYVKTAEELRIAFNWMDDDTFKKCMDNTVEIADKCDVEIQLGKSHLPSYPVPEGYDTNSYFDYLCRKGLKERYGDPIPANIEERYLYEKGVIDKMGFPAYFLITWDFINWAKTHGVPTGPGRGSAAGSIVAYALGITELDPILHNLLFERFLNPERISMPDIDIDFCKRNRGRVIDYVTEKYGEDHVCQIITFGTLAAKAAVKAVARVYNIPFADSNRISGMIPSTPGIKIDDALLDGMELRKLYDSDANIKKWIDEAKHLEGLKNQVGTHAAGVIISHKPLDQIIPIALSKEKTVTTQFPMVDIEKIGLLKMDFLGLETLTIISDTMEFIKERHGIEFDINKIPLDDPKTFELLQHGQTDAVFQLESAGMKKLVKELKPTVFEDLGALVALFRPGPLESGMVKDFVDRKHGRQKIVYDHPLLENILKDTYGTLVYQEQIMQIFQVLAGYTLGGADSVRRMMGKKKLEEMAKQKGIFIEGAGKNGMPEASARNLFEQIENFAKYCFNRAHSAAYAFVAYQTAYLKAHYPVEFMCANLSSQADNQDKTQAYILQCENLGIEVLAPDINKSNSGFTPDGNNIRFGMNSIKNVGEAVIEEIMKERENGEFKSFVDFCERVDSKCLNKKTLESLIKSGCFATLEKSRKQLLMNIDNVTSFVQNTNKNKMMGQASLFAAFADNEDLNIPTCELLGTDEEFEAEEIQQFEKELMGIYVTSHPLDNIKDTLKYITSDTIAEIIEAPKQDQKIVLCGLLTQVVQKPTRKDPSKFIKTALLEDLTGRIEVVAFPKIVEKIGALMQSETKVILEGKVQVKEENINIIIDEIRLIGGINLWTLKLNDDLNLEENTFLKEILAKHKGDNPVVIDFDDNGNRKQIVTNRHIWIDNSPEVEKNIKSYFKERIELSVAPLC